VASTNQSPFYKRAEEEFLLAQTDEERMACLEIMIKECPKHKSSENMLRNLTTRYKKLKDSVDRKKKGSKVGPSQQGIKKADMQCVLFGPANVGKSTIFNILTKGNPESKISQYPHTTNEPIIGTFDFEDVKIQIIDDAPIPDHNKSLVNSTGTLLIIFDNLNQLDIIEKQTWKSYSNKIYIYNKIDNLSTSELRKLKETVKSKYRKLNVQYFSKDFTEHEVEHIKKIIFETFPIIRIYTKEPGKERSHVPMILKKDSKVEDVAEKILKGLSKDIFQTKIWGPSSKFAGQLVGTKHILKDRDVVEFKSK